LSDGLEEKENPSNWWKLRLISILRVRRETGLLSLRQNRKYAIWLKLRDAAPSAP